MDTTILKAIDILDALSRGAEPRGVSDLARDVQLTKSNVHRILKTLASRGFVTQDPQSARYCLGLRLWEFGTVAVDRLDVKRVASRALSELAGVTRETVHLSVLSEADVVYVDKIDSPEPVRAYSRVGGRAPAYCVATGKALLAYASDTAVHTVARGIVRHTERTVRNESELRRELDDVRRRGYALNHGEWRESVFGIAAPVRQAPGHVVAAVGISGPADRLRPKRMKELIPLVMATAAEISTELGWRPGVERSLEAHVPPRPPRSRATSRK